MKSRSGFALVELLIVIAILGILITLILVVVGSSRAKARDTRIRTGISQLRTTAETIYDSQGASYLNWSQAPAYQSNLNIILNDIDTNYGDVPGVPYVTMIRDTQTKNFCISTPLASNPNLFYCVDGTGEFVEVSSHCPEAAIDDPPLRCPSS